MTTLRPSNPIHRDSVGIRNPSRLQCCFRDICVGCAHMVFDDRNYVELAKGDLGLETPPH